MESVKKFNFSHLAYICCGGLPTSHPPCVCYPWPGSSYQAGLAISILLSRILRKFFVNYLEECVCCFTLYKCFFQKNVKINIYILKNIHGHFYLTIYLLLAWHWQYFQYSEQIGSFCHTIALLKMMLKIITLLPFQLLRNGSLQKPHR